MKSKLNLDFNVVNSARQHAANIAHDMQDFIDRHTTVSTERTILRLLGVDGVDEVDNPLPNVVVDQIKEAGALPTGFKAPPQLVQNLPLSCILPHSTHCSLTVLSCTGEVFDTAD